MKTLVIYHANCRDGFCAAWLLWKCLPKEETDFHAASYGEDPPDITGYEYVYIVDFSYKRDVLEKLLNFNIPICIMDHHKSAEEDVKINHRNLRVIFEIGKSGGRLVWEYIVKTPELASLWPDSLEEAPFLVDYTEDRDLWNWKLPASKEVNTALESYPMDFDVWNDLNEDGVEVLSEEGITILRFKQQLIDAAVRNAKEIRFPVTIDNKTIFHKVLIVNSPVFQSEIGEALAQGRDFGVCYFDRKDGKRVFSLRSRGDSGSDVSVIAKSKGGGGHRNAAGFEMDFNLILEPVNHDAEDFMDVKLKFLGEYEIDEKTGQFSTIDDSHDMREYETKLKEALNDLQAIGWTVKNPENHFGKLKGQLVRYDNC